MYRRFGAEKTFVHFVAPYMDSDEFVKMAKRPPAKEEKRELFHWSHW